MNNQERVNVAREGMGKLDDGGIRSLLAMARNGISKGENVNYCYQVQALAREEARKRGLDRFGR